MSLNTPAELAALTGTTLPDNILVAILDTAYRVAAARLAPYGLTPCGDICKAAELKLAQCELLTRQRLDGSRPGSLTLGDYSATDNLDNAIIGLRSSAYELLDQYVQTNAKRILCIMVNR